MYSTTFLPHVEARKTEPIFCSELRTEEEKRRTDSFDLSPRSRLFLDQCDAISEQSRLFLDQWETTSQPSTSTFEEHVATACDAKTNKSETSRSDLDELYSGSSSPTVSWSFERQESWYEASMLDENTFVHVESVRLASGTKKNAPPVENLCTAATAPLDALAAHAQQIAKADDRSATPELAHQGLIMPASLRQPEASVGSALHGTGQCKPCAWFWKPEGCSNSGNCRHCHMCGRGELKRNKKIKMQARRALGSLEAPMLAALHGNLTLAVMP
eukprot:TRINITY_DN28736_c0_g1_i2.p1 TRINITY_DN28736_c0_g1~~TRINITY_DN28736_c0_g1_i2.p1  ORF type:complete len:273 (+),score=45.74 TRINITY_DN28736_c0_g1_i2:103-921(+)